MAYPNNGLIKIYPANATIVSGQYSLNSDAAPQVLRTAADLDTYYQARVTNLATAPCLRRATEIPAASGVYVPNSGDHEVSFSSSTQGIEFWDGSYPSGSLVATLDYLSADFPLGMTVNQVKVHLSGQTYFGASRDRHISIMEFNYFGSLIDTYTGANNTLVTFTNLQTPSNSIIAPPFSWSPIRMFKPFGFTIPVDAVVSALTQTPRAVISEVFITAQYNTQTFNLTNNTPLAIPGEFVDLTDANNALGIFTDYKIYWDTNEDLGEEDGEIPGLTGGVTIPTRYFFVRTNGRIRFQIPENLGIPYGGRRLLLFGVGSGLLTGEVELAQLNILLVDGSGVYKLTEDKRNDTYYNRATTPVTTTNLKFPRPGFRTGFF